LYSNIFVSAYLHEHVAAVYALFRFTATLEAFRSPVERFPSVLDFSAVHFSEPLPLIAQRDITVIAVPIIFFMDRDVYLSQRLPRQVIIDHPDLSC